MTRTLLLADDSVTIQRVIELTFADEDIQVVAVGDGDQAIAQLEEHPPDVVLADVVMPGKSGYEVSSYIKQSERLAHIPVLLLTGAFEPVDQRRADESRCDGVLAKPFEPQFVIARVKELLGLPSTKGIAATMAPTVVIPRPPADSKGASESTVKNGQGASETTLTDYLDQLDAALANPQLARTESPVAGTDRRAAEAAAPEQESARDLWAISFDAGPAEARIDADAPTSTVDRIDRPPPAVSQQIASAPTSPPVPQTSVAHPPRHAQPALPALAEAFAALLVAEQSASPPPATVWPTQTPPTDDLVERVVERVLERLSDRVVRERVSELVSVLAERLIREEIERIKASNS